MSLTTNSFFDFYRETVLPCLEENLLKTPHHFLNVTAPYFVAFSAIDHLAAIRDKAVLGREQNNNTKIKSFLEDPKIWKYGKHISLRKLYLDVVQKERDETDSNKKAIWATVRDKLNQEWNLKRHIDTALVSLKPDCTYEHFLQRISDLQIPIQNHENYKYSHLLYTLRCDLMHENRPTEQDALFEAYENKPRYANGTDVNGYRKTELSFPAKVFWDILSNALDYLETECVKSVTNPRGVKVYKGLTPRDKQKIAIVGVSQQR